MPIRTRQEFVEKNGHPFRHDRETDETDICFFFHLDWSCQTPENALKPPSMAMT